MAKNSLKKANGYCKRRRISVNGQQTCDRFEPFKPVKRRVCCCHCTNFTLETPVVMEIPK